MTTSRPFLQRLVLVRPGEGRALLWAAAYFFFLLLSYYLLRPVREAMGIAKGADKLPWLMSLTLLVMLVANPLYARLVSRWPRRRFIPAVSHFFAANLLVFVGLMAAWPGAVWLGYAFYVWLSVFNLFVVSVFWSLMSDVFREEQGRRLFGLISMGGTLGAVAGAALTDALSRGSWGVQLGPAALMGLSVLALELAVACMGALRRHFGVSEQAQPEREPGPSALEGWRAIAGSRYLQALCGYMLLYALTSTFLYLSQGEIVARSFASGAERTAAFARLDLWVNVLTLATQLFLTGRLLRWIGVSGVLLVLPTLTLAGFGALALWPTFAVLAAVQVLRRGLHYAVDRPARELLYIPLGPEERYKSKPFIDTFVYRVGDVLGVWAPTLMSLLALPVSAAALGFAGLWLWNGHGLGRLVSRRAAASEPPPATPSAATPSVAQVRS